MMMIRSARMAIILKQLVFAAGQFFKPVHRILDNAGRVEVIFIGGFAALENTSGFWAVPRKRMFGIPARVCDDGYFFLIDHFNGSRRRGITRTWASSWRCGSHQKYSGKEPWLSGSPKSLSWPYPWLPAIAAKQHGELVGRAAITSL